MYHTTIDAPAQGLRTIAPPELLADLPPELQPGAIGEVGLYAQYQPAFGEHGIATFPVVIDGKTKKWAVRNPDRMGLKASYRMASESQFRSSNAFGFVAGARSGLTILDIDSADENHVADAMAWQGHTPLVTRTRSGGYHLYFANDGETGRHIRAWDDRPFDQLAGGLIVAPPSRGTDGGYSIVTGCLDDLAALPTMRDPYRPIEHRHGGVERISDGRRHDALFGICMREARHCDDYEDVLDVAMTANATFLPPLPEADVISTAKSAWGYEERGENYTGGRCAIMSMRQVDSFASEPYTGFLLMWLKAHNGPESVFWVANGLTDVLGWSRKQVRDARSRLIDLGFIVPTTHPRKGHPVLFRWGPARLSNR